ncbi:hypothetical protein ACFZC6_01945 [Streptomyces ossamyceticus]|uniref:hypothetical protein n=1 Tax=Streptomyces ossamyceticus TaxID=249581 RepID=UPI0036F0142A
MTDRIPLDHLTSDALDALYEELEAAEQTESQRQLATAREALASATTRAARAEAALARVHAYTQRLAAQQHGVDIEADSLRRAIARDIAAALAESGPAATQATEPDTKEN